MILIYKVSFHVCAVFLLIASAYTYIGIKYSLREKYSSENLRKKKIDLDLNFYENIAHFETIKITVTEGFFYNQFSQKNSQLLSFIKSHARIFLLKSLYQNIILYLGLLFVLTTAVISVQQELLSIGDIIILNIYFFQLTSPLTEIARYQSIFNQAIVNIKPLTALLSIVEDLKTIPPEKHINTDKPITIKVDNIQFQQGLITLLTNVTFSVEQGHKLGIVGPSGGGKSTIVKLLMRFYDPTSGSIKINHINIKHIPLPNLRSLIGYVPQEVVLFNGTILSNILLGREALIDKDYLEQVYESDILSFVKGFKYGLNTIVGDRGSKLSYGEKQRVAIARALIAKPKILILDEYNSALDLVNEKKINKAIETLSINSTIIAIVHRISAIIHYSEIIVIEEGAISQRGKHNDLIASEGWYCKAWNNLLQDNKRKF